jgi:hypothetical protein
MNNEINIGEGYKITCEKKDNLQHWLFAIIPEPIMFFVYISLLLPKLTKPLDPKCGVIITLHHNEYVQGSTQYRFTDNAEWDAMGIQKIISSYKKHAEEDIARAATYKKREREEKERCCTQFKAVMEKVNELCHLK